MRFRFTNATADPVESHKKPCEDVFYGGIYDYIVRITDETGVSETEADSSMKFYPNPTTGNITVSEDVINVNIYNGNGQKVLSVSNKRMIDLSSLQSGIYTIRMSDGLKVKKESLIKK